MARSMAQRGGLAVPLARGCKGSPVPESRKVREGGVLARPFALPSWMGPVSLALSSPRLIPKSRRSCSARPSRAAGNRPSR